MVSDCGTDGLGGPRARAILTLMASSFWLLRLGYEYGVGGYYIGGEFAPGPILTIESRLLESTFGGGYGGLLGMGHRSLTLELFSIPVTIW